MISRFIVVAMCAIGAAIAPIASADVFDMDAPGMSLQTVRVGDPGNPDDLGTPRPREGGFAYFGGVDYVYRIGKFEVTAGQYAQFLNAVAATDDYGLYDQYMNTSYANCGIEQAGQNGSYTYTVNPNYINRPVMRVSWGDAARFCNWLGNGQPTGRQVAGTTETGSYLLNGATSDADLGAVTRQPGATWVLPTHSEWAKAAYYSGSGDVYHAYATGTDDPPSNVLGETDPGNNATFYDNAAYDYPDDAGYTAGNPFYTTEVGAHENSPSYYGTFDQSGNAQEWNEHAKDSSFGLVRCKKGGSFSNDLYNLQMGTDYYVGASYEGSYLGFRVAQVPEPTSLAILLIGGAVPFAGRRRRRRTMR